MIACGLMKVVENQRGRQWTDPDIDDGKPNIVEPRTFDILFHIRAVL